MVALRLSCAVVLCYMLCRTQTRGTPSISSVIACFNRRTSPSFIGPSQRPPTRTARPLWNWLIPAVCSIGMCSRRNPPDVRHKADRRSEQS